MPEEQTQADSLKKLRDMIKDIDFCMLTTIDESGDLHSRPMSSNGEVDPNGDLWFFTGGSSQKVSEIANSPKVNVSLQTEESTYVSVTGLAQLVEIGTRSKNLEARVQKWFPEGKDDPEVACEKSVLKSRIWDSPSSTIGYALSFVSSLVTGKQPEFGENKKLEFD